MSTPTLVPAADRAPSLASRVVTIHATDVTEGAPAPDHFSFSLPCALRVPSDDVILRPGGVKVRLVDGRAKVRLPVYSPSVQTIDGSTDWVIVVSPSWGQKYAVRVPAGTSEINLADLPAVRPLTRREQQYAITGVGVTVTEGTQAGGSASYVNGQLDLKIQVPSFRPATVYPYIDQQVLALTDQREQEIRDDLDERLEQVTTAYDLAVEMGYEGDLSEWLESLVGPRGADSEVPGPPNVLTVGEVTTGDAGSDAAATITGAAPAQVLGLTIPRGDKGDKGDQGDASTVPGPTGKTSYEYAVDAGFEGTEQEFADAQMPDTVTWFNVDDKPTEYPPEAHPHDIEDIDGLGGLLDSILDPEWSVLSVAEGVKVHSSYPLQIARAGTWRAIRGRIRPTEGSFGAGALGVILTLDPSDSPAMPTGTSAVQTTGYGDPGHGRAEITPNGNMSVGISVGSPWVGFDVFIFNTKASA